MSAAATTPTVTATHLCSSLKLVGSLGVLIPSLLEPRDHASSACPRVPALRLLLQLVHLPPGLGHQRLCAVYVRRKLCG